MQLLDLPLHAATSALPAPLPEFMDDAQAAKWTADQEATAKAAAAKETATTSSEQTPTVFFTGKPYVANAGGYIYKYRTYNPEMSRWTSADPSGFPDGLNNNVYASNPVCELDANGLTPQWINGSYTETAAWTEEYNIANILSDPTIGLSFPLGISVSFSAGSGWAQTDVGTNYSITDGTTAELAPPPAGQTWSTVYGSINDNGNTNGETQHKDTAPTYGSSYQFNIGTEDDPSYVTLENVTYNITYYWARETE
jgi:RHS repeat-associated protein